MSDIPEITATITAGAWEPALAGVAERVALAALRHACPGIGPAGIALVLADDATIRELNRDWRGKDAPTNVLSFPATEIGAGTVPTPPHPGVPLELGDVILAYETCSREAREQGKTLTHHLDHLVVHGVLHLLGYDHEDDAEAEQMERLEVEVLGALRVPDPYAVTING